MTSQNVGHTNILSRFKEIHWFKYKSTSENIICIMKQHRVWIFKKHGPACPAEVSIYSQSSNMVMTECDTSL